MVAVVGASRISHHLTLSGVDMYVTFGAQGGDDSIDYDAMAEQHGQAWMDNIVPITSNRMDLAETLAYSLEDPTIPAGQFIPSTQGGADVDPAPLNCAFGVTLKTAKRGRSYTGRIYIPGFGRVNMQSDGRRWTGAMVEAVSTAMAGYLEQVDPDVGETARLVVASPTLGTYEPVTAFVCHEEIRTQRRRLQ